jgi:hypothetical protein
MIGRPEVEFACFLADQLAPGVGSVEELVEKARALRIRCDDPARAIAAFAKMARPIMRRYMSANSCIAAARTTIEVLRIFGIPAAALPVKYSFAVPSRLYQRVAGLSDEERAEVRKKVVAFREEKDEEGGWEGHLIVLASGYLLECTIDQMGSEEFGVRLPEEILAIDTRQPDSDPGYSV